MGIEIIEERLKQFNPKTKQDEKNGLREITHEIALAGLSRTDFFRRACFIGGSCLRIFHGLDRFSADLDFWLLQPDQAFAWKDYLVSVKDHFDTFGFEMVVQDRHEVEPKIKRAFLKKDSIGKLLILKHGKKYDTAEKIEVKFEIDTYPPQGAGVELKRLNYPFPFSVTTLDSASLFASKVSALFDPNQIKGRHLYDFIWYIKKRYPLNLELLSNALREELTGKSLIEKLVGLVRSVNWKEMQRDMKPFVSQSEFETVNSWDTRFFLGYLEELENLLKPPIPSLADFLASHRGKEPSRELLELLGRGANVNDSSKNDHRPLQLALAKNYLEVAKQLIVAGADLNYRDSSGQTPLQTAVNHGHFALGKLLIEKGAIFKKDGSNLAFDQAKLHDFLNFLSS